MQINIDPSKTLHPVPAMRGSYLGDSPVPLMEQDVARLRDEVGATCIRFGIEAVWLASETQEIYHEEGFARVREMLDWCDKYSVHCVLDIHNALGRRFGGDPRLWREEAFQDRFVKLWEKIAVAFRDHPANAAYELLNEPEPPADAQHVWNPLYKRTLAAIRKIDKDRACIVNSVGYAKPGNFAILEPADDPNVVYSFHNYAPGPYHAQKRRELKDQSTYYYPGYVPLKRPQKPEEWQDFNMCHYAPTEAKHWNRQQLIEEWAAVWEFQEKYDRPLFCGEFGCVSDVPEMTDMIYLMDEISIFQERNIHWTLYNTMYRTEEEYWKTHFDCGMFIAFHPTNTIYRFGKKIALIEFFCRTEGEVLSLEQPTDEFIGLYGVRQPDGSTALLVSNKDREKGKKVQLKLAGLPQQWYASLKTMSRGDDGFVAQPAMKIIGGSVELDLGALTLAQVTVPALPQASWTRALLPQAQR